MIKVKLGLRGLTIQEKLEKAKAIQEKLESAPEFDNIEVVNELRSSISGLEKAIEIAAFGDQRAIAARNLCTRKLEDTLRKTAVYVETRSQGDEALISKSGFAPRKRNNQPKPVRRPAELKTLRTDKSGEVVLSWKPVKNSRSYMIQLSSKTAPSEKDFNTVEFSTRSRLKIENLKPGKIYHFRIVAMGAGGIGPPSEIKTFMAA